MFYKEKKWTRFAIHPFDKAPSPLFLENNDERKKNENKVPKHREGGRTK